VTRPSWILPDGLEECLPEEAWAIEAGRRACLDLFRDHEFGLIMPPMLEYLDSLTSGVGQDLADQIMVVTDRVSGRLMGIRPDMTPQAARIDAHALNESGVTKLCYCGSVLRAVASGGETSRSPLQLGAEIFGDPRLEADIAVVQLALDTVRLFTDEPVLVDFGHMGALKALLQQFDDAARAHILDALVRKDREALAPFAARETALETVRQAYGDLETVLSKIDGVASLRLAGSEITDIAKALNGGALSVSVDLAKRTVSGITRGLCLAFTRCHAINYWFGVVAMIMSASHLDGRGLQQASVPI